MPTRKNRETEIAVIRPAQPRSTLRTVVGATERRLAGAMEIPVEQVMPDPGQPRQDWAHGEGARRLDELAASIREFGLLQPLLVREEGTLTDGRQRYIIIAGERRHTAATRIGLVTVPVIVRGDEAMQVRILQLIENVQRQDLSPLDEARAYQELMDAENLTPPMLAARLHLSSQHVRDRLRLMGDQVFADAVARGQLSATTARDILQLPENEIARLRDKVRVGEPVQAQDVATVRERLAASGVVNPRRKQRATKKQTAFVSSVESVPSNVAFPAGLSGEAQNVTTAMPSDTPALQDGKKQTAFVSSELSVPLVDKNPIVIAPEQTTQHDQGDAKKQTAFVSSGLSLPIATLHPLVSQGARDTAGDAEPLTAFAARIAEMIGDRLSDKDRTQFLALLEATRADRSAAAQWWLLVDAHLRAQHGKPSIS